MIACYGRFIIKPYNMSYDTIKGHTAVKAKLSEIAKIGTDKYPKIFTISFNIIFVEAP